MNKIMSAFPISVLSAAVLFAGCAAMPVQAAAGKTVPVTSTTKPKTSTASEVLTASPAGDGYPLQLGVKMTSMQANEFEKVNEYRAEAGIKPLEFDPELAAAACYRAWVDIAEGYEAMVNPKYKYFGCSHTYFGNNRIPESKRRSESAYDKPMMTAEFDMFADTLSTPVHP